ncbi:MAG: hypothetical protein WB816_02445 [Methylocystis sp.]
MNRLLTRTFARPIDCAGLMPGLGAVARAINEGDLARAMIATTQMRLPTLSEDEASRAAAATELAKAAADDPDHPGWPAGTPGGRGGQFRPKDEPSETVKETRKKKTEAELPQLIRRRLIRETLRRVLTPQRVMRLAGEVAANAIPMVNVAADVAAAGDIAAMAADSVELKREADAALDFIKNAPYKLDDLRVGMEDKSFSSFDAFKNVGVAKFHGPAGDGYDYHHIVEQGKSTDFSSIELNSTTNIVRIPRLIHEEINSEFGLRDSVTKTTMRQRLKGRSFEEQLQEGLGVMTKIGIIE